MSPGWQSRVLHNAEIVSVVTHFPSRRLCNALWEIIFSFLMRYVVSPFFFIMSKNLLYFIGIRRTSFMSLGAEFVTTPFPLITNIIYICTLYNVQNIQKPALYFVHFADWLCTLYGLCCSYNNRNAVTKWLMPEISNAKHGGFRRRHDCLIALRHYPAPPLHQ